MIFSKIFKQKAKWQHKNSNVRIEAINNELNENNPEDCTILRDLVKTDENELVRRTALIKLNSATEYAQASLENTNSKVKQFARQQFELILLGEHKITLTVTEKEAFLAQKEHYKLNKAFLEKWLLQETELPLIEQLFIQLEKPQLSNRLFTHTKAPAIQLFLIEPLNDINELEKLAKKALNEQVSDAIQHKVAALKVQQEKPIVLRKQTQLVLSKLLALKDVNDYATVIEKQKNLAEQWQTLQQDFSCFSAEEQQTFLDKHQHILTQLEKIFVAKKEQYQQQQIALKLQQQQTQLHNEVTQQIEQLSNQLVDAVFNDTITDKSHYEQQFIALINHIEQSCLTEKSKQNFLNKIAKQQARLAHIDDIAKSVSDATQLISKVSQLALPENIAELNERYPLYLEWQKAWQNVVQQSDGLLPAQIVLSSKEIKQRWQQGCELLLKEQKQLFQQVQKKCIDIKRLLKQGKYNACFGLHKSLLAQHQLLSEHQQRKLQKDITFIGEKIAELSDWEHYIATPKKQELLDAVQALVDTPCDDPNSQSQKVKAFRKTWNSLGHADDDVDKTFNDKFNELCELAFAPCRAFYAEQDKIRENNAQKRREIISQAQALFTDFNQQQQDNSVDFKALDAAYIKLQKLWKNAGEVDRNLYKNLMNEYKTVIDPIKQALFTQYERNAVQKQQLIKQVNDINNQFENLEDHHHAIAQVKSLQNQWRDIGYAGSKQENQLWQEFRKVNDAIFAQRNEQKKVQDSLLQDKQQALQTTFAQLKEQCEQLSATADEHSQLIRLRSQAEQLLDETIAIKPPFKVLIKDLKQFITLLNDTVSKLEKSTEQQQWLTLFSLLELMANNEFSLDALEHNDDFQQLSPFWQKRVLESYERESSIKRDVKTLELEILAGVESPEELTQQRMEVQVGLMQEQMTAGSKPDLNNVLAQWLQLGKLTPQDLPYIERLKTIFIEQALTN